MEITGNKYLHKKFKKQTNCSPIYNRIENKNDSSVLIPVVNNNGIPCRDGGVVRSEPVNFLLFNKDNNKYVESVPNFNSTNCDSSLVTTDTDRCSQLDRDVNVVTLDNQSSISNVEVSVNVATQCNNNSSVTKELFYNNRRYRCNNDEPIEQQNFTSNVTNISTTTTTSTSLLGKDVRNFTFDNNTKINHSETATSTPKIVKSSILDTVYSKSNIISTDRLINTSSSQSIIKPDESAKLEPNPPVTTAENTTTEKKCPESSSSSTSGGKYVCTYCNLACSKPSVLQKHIRAHTNERPYPCVSCGFSFKTRSNLYKHCRSRTHANRVMGNKHHVQTNQTDAAASDSIDSSSEKTTEEKDELEPEEKSEKPTEPPEQWEQQKTKPYKPRFHTAKLFFEENNKPPKDLDLEKTANPDLLKSRINELIHKNNSIMNCDDAVVIRRRNIDTIAENNNSYFEPQTAPVHWQQPVVDYNNRTDEQPLNLTAKNRKRCLSDSDHTQKSLIKELLLKNLSTDPNLQCPYCKMIFQTVTELEMHKLKYCNAKTSNIRYARSSSVNVASILTQNKNAFDNIPHMQHTTFPLKSPGPCLGKTRLIENERHNSEKYRTFSFDDTVILHNTQSDAPSFNKYMLQSPVGTYPLSPQIKKNPVRLFGGEVKITQTSGETRSFKIESSESINKMDEQNFMDFRTSLSENFVIKSGLHSGGTVLQNKSNYSPKIDSLPSPNTIRMYDNTPEMSPNLLGDKFIFDKLPRQNEKLLNNNEQFKRGFPSQDKFENYDNGLRPDIINEKEQELYKSNLIDFGQKAVKMLAPNLKPPNLSIPGLPIPGHDKYSPMVPLEINITEDNNKMDKQHLENLNFAKKQINLQQRMAEVPQPQHVFNPMSLLVNGKVIPYVPGIPGPVVDAASDVIYNPIANRVKYPKEMPKSPISKYPAQKSPRPTEESRDKDPLPPPNGIKTPTIIVDHTEGRQNFLNALPPRSDPVSRIAETKTTPSNLTVSSATSPSKEESRKFVRPTSLALKPTSCAFKSHHGLTPTMFNQALISPDTPRVAKKYCQQYLNGNYFSYLGLKSSTKSVYCTLNKTQPYYVKHFKKLSMYSEWRQQESKIDGLSVSAYDSRQRQNKYTMAGHAKADLIAHSSYKFVITESSSTKEENSNKSNSVLGGYESNEDYTYIRGRGRGRYVCDQCGIRCKKPSMLKKHIRTHSDDRPYTCEHCNFRIPCFCSFKTKGNLTKHMKSKAHSKKYAATSSTSARNSVTTSSDSEESDAESSDESTRLQEHEAAHCLLSLSQKNNQPIVNRSEEMNSSSVTSTYTSISNTTVSTLNLSELPNFLKDDKFLKNPDQITQVTNTNFVKNKILDEASCNFNIASKHLSEVFETAAASTNQENTNNVSQYLGKSATIRPLTYPYLQTNVEKHDDEYIPKEKYDETIPERPNIKENNLKIAIVKPQINNFMIQNVEGNLPTNIVYRKRKISTSSNIQYKLQRNENLEAKAVDLSVQVQEIPILDLSPTSTTSEHTTFNGQISRREEHHDNPDSHYSDRISDPVIVFNTQKPRLNSSSESSSSESFSQNSDTYDRVICKPILDTLDTSLSSEKSSFERKTPDFNEHDQSAMQTLAEIAIKQVKLEKNIMAKNVASEYLKLALNCDGNSTDGNLKKFAAGSKETVNDLIVKPEENKNCSICSKNFSKPSQLRLHMNIHYLERPFRCESCSVSFRTKGHLQKHERSASHHNKLSSSPALSSSEPRPFKCTDCNIAFRIHGHLAKHLRSKMHIMKLECSAKIPFGLYAELERANSLLTEINTTDGDLCLESLKILARKLFSNDPNKLDQLGNTADSQDS